MTNNKSFINELTNFIAHIEGLIKKETDHIEFLSKFDNKLSKKFIVNSKQNIAYYKLKLGQYHKYLNNIIDESSKS